MAGTGRAASLNRRAMMPAASCSCAEVGGVPVSEYGTRVAVVLPDAPLVPEPLDEQPTSRLAAPAAATAYQKRRTTAARSLPPGRAQPAGVSGRRLHPQDGYLPTTWFSLHSGVCRSSRAAVSPIRSRLTGRNTRSRGSPDRALDHGQLTVHEQPRLGLLR